MNLKSVTHVSLKIKLLGLSGFFVFGLVSVQLINLYMEKEVRTQLIFPKFEAQVLEGHKQTLKSLVDVEALVLAERLKGVKTRAEQDAVVIAETDPIRFFEGGTGYYFTYHTNGVRINVPINKSQNNQNLMGTTDANGFLYVQGLIQQGQSGGGFLRYAFEKTGQGVQPKLSYTSLIPGTDIVIGTGVYIDDVETERAALAEQIQARNWTYEKITLAVFVVIMCVMVSVTFWLSQFLSRTIGKITGDLLAGSDQVAAAAMQVSSSSQILAEGAGEQAASIEETSASLEELSSMTKHNADNAQSANDLARQARTAADKGVADVQEMNQAMAAIQTSSHDIAKIIKTIDEIAFQTNILALNAAVEAARAGESGMGFAVVADEVRNLAQRSATAAKETAAEIETAIHNTAQGVAISQKVMVALNEIVAKTREVDELAAKVATASQEQTSGIAQINTAIGRMDHVTQSNAATAEESAAAAQELSAQAAVMRQSVNSLTSVVAGQVRHESATAGVQIAPKRTPLATGSPKFNKAKSRPAASEALPAELTDRHP